MKTQRSFGYALIGMMSLFAALQGCSDDADENDKPPVVIPTAGKSASGGSDGENGGAGANTSTAGKAGSSNGGKGAEAGESTNPVAGGGGASAGSGGEGGAGGAYEPECLLPELGEDGCYNCPKNGQTEQWLNRCLDTECVPFDNDRLPLLNADGSLPALP